MTPSKKSLDLRVSAKKKEKKRKINKYLDELRINCKLFNHSVRIFLLFYSSYMHESLFFPVVLFGSHVPKSFEIRPFLSN
jgi:hypothetical protein